MSAGYTFIFATEIKNIKHMKKYLATFMIKNGYLSANNIIGEQHFLTVSGEISEDTI